MALLPVGEAVARVLADVAALPSETVKLNAARGRILADSATALRAQPAFNASAMDGYAVRAADTSLNATLRQIGVSAAGRGFNGQVGEGEAVRIFTGAPVPEGADTILIQEDATALNDIITVREAPGPARHIRKIGIDFAAGEAPFAPGRALSPRDLGLLAAMGLGEISVIRRPRIAILATGDELVPAGAEPGRDQIVASSSVMISAFVEAEGGEAVDLGIARDRLDILRGHIEQARAANADVLVTLGGASVGDHDLVQAALSQEGAKLDFWRIAMRPGKPAMFGRMGAMPVLGLPGNPVSTYVCSILFLRPLIRKLLGRPDFANQLEPAVLGRDLRANDEREDYLRSSLATDGDRTVATPFETQDSSMMKPLALSDCLVVRLPHAPAAKRGDACQIVRLASII